MTAAFAAHAVDNDVRDAAVLAAMPGRLGYTVAETHVSSPDDALVAANDDHIAAARVLMARHRPTGVPAILLDGTPLPARFLFDGRAALFTALSIPGTTS